MKHEYTDLSYNLSPFDVLMLFAIMMVWYNYWFAVMQQINTVIIIPIVVVCLDVNLFVVQF